VNIRFRKRLQLSVGEASILVLCGALFSRHSRTSPAAIESALPGVSRSGSPAAQYRGPVARGARERQIAVRESGASARSRSALSVSADRGAGLAHGAALRRYRQGPPSWRVRQPCFKPWAAAGGIGPIHSSRRSRQTNHDRTGHETTLYSFCLCDRANRLRDTAAIAPSHPRPTDIGWHGSRLRWRALPQSEHACEIAHLPVSDDPARVTRAHMRFCGRTEHQAIETKMIRIPYSGKDRNWSGRFGTVASRAADPFYVTMKRN